MQAPGIVRRAPRSAVLTAGVALGLFAARELGELVPDSLAASVAMFSAGLLVGLVFGLAARGRPPTS